VPQEQAATHRLIWDLPTRLVHWAIALSFVGSWVTAEAGFDWTETHFRFGYCTLGLVLFRVLWGLVGPTHARFASFVKGPRPVWQHIQHLWQPPKPEEEPEAPGHNALGGWAVLLLLLSLAVQAGTGLFLTDDIFYAGPYNPVVSADTASWLAGIHHWNFRLLQGLVALHLLAIAWYQLRLKQNLVVPMLSGKKSGQRVAATAAIESSALWRALCIAVLVGLGIWLLLSLAPEPIVVDYF
jgi:cytochrome b